MGVQASREPRCQNVSCSSKWTFRDVNCAVMDGNAAEICAQSVIDCNKESCSAIAAPGKVGSELERVRQDMKTWFFSQMEIIPADSKLLSAVSGLVHAGNAAWECNMSGAQYTVKAAFDNVVKIPVVLSCLRKLHSYATKDAGSIQQRLKKAEETTKAYIQVFSELIRQHEDVHDCYEMYRKQECKRPSKSLNNYYKNGVKRIVEHAHAVYVCALRTHKLVERGSQLGRLFGQQVGEAVAVHLGGRRGGRRSAADGGAGSLGGAGRRQPHRLRRGR